MKLIADAKRLRQELSELQAMPLVEKVALSGELIAQGLAKGKSAVMWSGGKDSTVLLHMARQQQPDVAVVFNNTRVEFPETLRFVRKLTEEWGLDLHVATPKQGLDFWWCVEKYGWPLLGKGIVRSDAHHFKRHLSGRQRKAVAVASLSSHCCEVLKKSPTRAVLRVLKTKVEVLGTMVTESRQRWFTWVDHGEFYLSKQARRWKLTPLYFWTEDDIWAYHQAYRIPHCKLYDLGYRRNGCWTCGMGIAFPGNNLSRLRLTHPKMWRFLMVDKGLGEVLLAIKLNLRDGQLDFFQDGKIEAILEQRPCYLDNLGGL